MTKGFFLNKKLLVYQLSLPCVSICLMVESFFLVGSLLAPLPRNSPFRTAKGLFFSVSRLHLIDAHVSLLRCVRLIAYSG